jgi:hypothetical protein
VGLYFLTRWMQSRRGFSQREYLVNAVDALTDAASGDLDEGSRRRALELIDQADPEDPLTEPIRRLLERVEAVPEREPNRLIRLARMIRARYLAAVGQPWFDRLVAAVFIVWAVGSLLTIATLALAFAVQIGGAAGSVEIAEVSGDDVSFINIGSLASFVVAGALVIAGVWRLRQGQRLGAYVMFERALLVAIFVGQFFAFVESQFAAVFGLILNVVLLITIRLMIRDQRDDPVQAPAAPVGASSGAA